MTRFFIHFLLLAVCAAAPAQTLKELEKAHKDKMKELKKSLKLKRVEIRQDPDGTYYMLLMSKSNLWDAPTWRERSSCPPYTTAS